MRSTLAVLVVLTAATLVAGCGGGGSGSDTGRPPREYAAAVCTSVSTWLKQIQDRTADLQTEIREIETGDLESAKSLLVEYLGDTVEYSDTLIDEVDDAGKPDVDHGEAIAGEVRAAMGRARTAFVDARTEAEGLPTDSPAAFQEETQEIGSTLQAQGKSIEETLDGVSERYDADELDQAFDNEEACNESS